LFVALSAWIAACGGSVRDGSNAAGTAGAGGSGGHFISSGGGPRPGSDGGSNAGSESIDAGSASGGASSQSGAAGSSIGGGAGGDGPEPRACLEEELLVITSALELAAFAARGCEVFDGSLSIEDSELTDLDILAPSPLRRITGTLALRNNAALTSIEALGGLERIGRSLVVEDNAVLAHLGGLEGLVGIGTEGEPDSLVISGNPRLSNVEPLSGAELNVDLYLAGNSSLTSLAGLDGLVRCRNITIAVNERLSAWGGLGGLEECSAITIASQPILGSIALPALVRADHLSITGNPELATVLVPSLMTVAQALVIAANDQLVTLGDLPALAGVGSLSISANPELPQCEVDRIASRLAVTCLCSGNDETALCD
jgi:hypothetical protein